MAHAPPQVPPYSVHDNRIEPRTTHSDPRLEAWVVSTPADASTKSVDRSRPVLDPSAPLIVQSECLDVVTQRLERTAPLSSRFARAAIRRIGCTNALQQFHVGQIGNLRADCQSALPNARDTALQDPIDAPQLEAPQAAHKLTWRTISNAGSYTKPNAPSPQNDCHR